MAKVFSKSVITAIDIGTTKICVLIAQKTSDETVDILGIGKAPSHGLSRGVVVDIGKTVMSIKQAIKEAELMADCQIDAAYIGISGSHIQSFNSSGAVHIKRGQVTHADIAAVLESARAVPVEKGQKVLHVLPQYFVVDGKDKISNPIGLHGIRLEAVVHVITGSLASMQDLIKCCELAGVRVQDIVLEQLASAQGVLSYDELELGVGMLDIGGGTSDFAVYQKGSIRYTKVFPIAGNMFTQDLAIGLRSTIADAERIKREHGYVGRDYQSGQGSVIIEQVQGKHSVEVLQEDISYILMARAHELFMMVEDEIRYTQLAAYLTSGLVITGGGSLLKGIDELAQDILSLPVRIGYPKADQLLFNSLQDPKYATGYGLLMFAISSKNTLGIEHMEGPLVKKLFVKMKSWVSDFF